MSDLPQYHPYAPFWDFVASVDNNEGTFAGHPFAAAYAAPYHRRGRGKKRPGNPTWGKPLNAQRRRRQEQANEPQSADSFGDEKMPPTPSTIDAEKAAGLPQVQEKQLGVDDAKKRRQFKHRGAAGRGGLRGRGGRHAPHSLKGQEATDADFDLAFHPMTTRSMRSQGPRARGRGLARRGVRFMADDANVCPPTTYGGFKKFGPGSSFGPHHAAAELPNLVLLDPKPVADEEMKGKAKGMKGEGKNKKAGKNGVSKQLKGKKGKANKAAADAAVTDADGPRKGFKKDFTPSVDVFNTTAAYVLHFSLPGAKKEDVKVNWNSKNSCLRIRGAVQRPADEVMLETMTTAKRSVGVFGKRVKLGEKNKPARVYPQGISAKLEDGILKVEVPKEDKDEEEYVEVKKVAVE